MSARPGSRVAARAIAPVGIAASLLVASSGCGPQQIPLDVRFPSTETFLVARSVRVRIYDVVEAGGCPALVTAVAGGRDPTANALYESSETTPCDLRTGVAIPDVGGGLRAFLVEGLDSTGNQTILAGCTEGEVFEGSRLEVALYPTARYQDAYDIDMPTPGETVESRCGGSP